MIPTESGPCCFTIVASRSAARSSASSQVVSVCSSPRPTKGAFSLHQGARRADNRARAAENARRFGQMMVEVDANARCRPAPREVDRRGADDFVADAGAPRAEDAVVRVDLDEGVRALRQSRPSLVVKALAAPAGEVDDSLKLALLVSRTGDASVGDQVVSLANDKGRAPLHARAIQAAVRVIRQQNLEHAQAV